MKDEKKVQNNNNNNSNNNGTKNAHAIQNDILYAKYVLRPLLWLASYSFVIFFSVKRNQVRRTNEYANVWHSLSPPVLCSFNMLFSFAEHAGEMFELI